MSITKADLVFAALSLPLAFCVYTATNYDEPDSKSRKANNTRSQTNRGREVTHPSNNANSKAPDLHETVTLIPSGLLHTATKGRNRGVKSEQLLLLALRPADPYLSKKASLLENAEKALTNLIDTVPTIPKLEQYFNAIQEVNSLVEALSTEGTPMLRATAIRLEPNSAKSLNALWQGGRPTIDTAQFERESRELLRVTMKPMLSRLPDGKGLQMSASTIKEAKAWITALEAEDPPDPDSEIPDMSKVKVNEYSSSQVRRFNRLISRLKKEVLRRYAARGEVMAVRAFTKIAITRSTELGFRHQLRSKKQVLRPQIQNEFRQQLNGVPSRLVHESNSSTPTIAETLIANTSIVLASFPLGATVTIDGKSLGKTPLVWQPGKMGQSVSLTAEKDGFKAQAQTFVVRPQLLPVGWLYLELEPI